jgi:hypothetical protein
MQPFSVSRIQLLYTVKEKRGKPDRKQYPLPFDLGNPYRNLESQNSQDYAQKPQQNCKFMNLAPGFNPSILLYAEAGFMNITISMRFLVIIW